MTKVAVFIGTRPEAIKMAPVIAALRQSRLLQPFVISTGQHKEMLQQVIDLFEIPVSCELAVMAPNQTLSGLTSRLLTAVDEVLCEVQPELVLVQGDTTTVLAAALAAFYRKIPIGHVEAGLRTRNLMAPFPEEANRRLATPLVDLHFAPTRLAQANLLQEGVPPDRVWVTGNTVIDALYREVACQDDPAVQHQLVEELDRLVRPDWRERPFVLITGHRRENFGEGFQQICEAVRLLAQRFREYLFIYPVHLNPNVLGPVQSVLGNLENVILTEPLGYRPFVGLLRHCRLVLTDSGGVQEEAPSLGKPVLVMRETTERPEGVQAGTVKLVGADTLTIVDGVNELLTNDDLYFRMSQASNPYGDGRAAGRIVGLIEDFFHQRSEAKPRDVQ